MSLLAIRDHLQQIKTASLGHLCQVFKTEPETMRMLLKHWINKGKIRCCRKKPACGSQCFQCPTLVTELYEWV